MFRRGPLAVVLALVLVLAACGNGDEVSTGDEPPADEPPTGNGQVDPGVIGDLSDEDAAEAAAAVNRFGFELHRTLAADGGNVVTSPLSVATLLAMVAAGAGGDTATQMAEVLGLDDVRDTRLAALLLSVTDTDDVTISVANALWANEGTPFEEEYLTFVRGAFAATVEEAPLGAQQTADDIDAWVLEQTEGLIDGIADALGLPNANAVLVLLNAVYFLGEWTVQFDPDLTRDGPFTLTDGTTVEVPSMYRPSNPDEQVHHTGRDGYEVLRLPYGDDERFAMDVFLPSVDSNLAELLDVLDVDERRAALDALRPTVLDLTLPRFELEWEDDLTEALRSMGLELALGPGADFTPMSPSAPWLDVVAHATYLRVDEEGTEAAAVTGGMMATSMPPSFTVDRPFLFTVSDTDTDAVLFLGTVEDPRG